MNRLRSTGNKKPLLNGLPAERFVNQSGVNSSMNKTQCERLLSRLERGPVNPMTALNELGVFRLAARVRDLRDEGHKITKQTVKVSNRFGEACRVAQYSLEQC